jgi:hypothetical protein
MKEKISLEEFIKKHGVLDACKKLQISYHGLRNWKLKKGMPNYSGIENIRKYKIQEWWK